MTGAQLKADHGFRRFVILKDGSMFELLYDMNAVMRHEKLFQVPMAALVKPIQKEVTDRVSREARDGESQQVVAARIAAGVAQEMVRQRIASGHIQDLAEWAYCLTETWREDHEIDMSWKQFRRLLHEPPPTGSATQRALRKLEAATAWMMAVAEVRAREEVDDEGNDQADATGPGAPSADRTGMESTGTLSTTSPPSSGTAPTASSGE